MEYWFKKPITPVLQYSNTPVSCLFHIADERFSFVHRNVRIGYEGRQLVDDVALG